MKRKAMFGALLAAMAAAAEPAAGRIKLVALPQRERVEIQLDNGAYTLVEEERIVPLQKSTAAGGNNTIDFSWSNATIDKDSIQFRPLAIREGEKFRPIRTIRPAEEAPFEEVAVINVAYPPNENALVWEVFSHAGCAVKVRVSYLISNLTRTFNYKALVDRAETHLLLRKYIQLRNYSGEDFGATGVWLGYGAKSMFPKAVGQQEEIKMLLYRFEKVPVSKTYTFDWHAHGPLDADRPFASRVQMHYELANQQAGGLGAIPLEPGKVRIFIEDARGGEAFLGEDWGQLTPIGGKMRLFVGQARDVVCRRMVEFKETRPRRGDLRDLEVVIRYEIENYKPDPVTLDIIEQMNRTAKQYVGDPRGDAEWQRDAKTSKELTFSYEFGDANPVLHVALPARPKDADVAKTVVRFAFTIKNVW